jgi:hypothetical protein
MTAAHRRASGRILLSGAIAGAATSFGFAALHHLLISNIWFSVLPMMAAGAACGVCLAWSYSLVFETRSPRGWLLYNLMFVGLFVLLGTVSFLLFEPVYTIAGLVAGTQSPGGLLRQAIPLSAGFGVLAGLGISALRRTNLRQTTSLVVTCLVLSVLLGHNTAILGLVHMSQEALPLLAEFYGLIAVVMLGNAGAFLLLERRGLFLPAAAATAAAPAGAEQVERAELV